MKNLIVFLVLFALPFGGLNAQSKTMAAPAVVWNQQFTFGGSYDIPWNIFISTNDGSIFVNGRRQIASKINAGLAKFSESTKVWTIVDDTASDAGNNAIAEIDGDLIWVMDGNVLTRRSPSTGAIKWKVVPSKEILSVISHKDTIVAVEVSWSLSSRVLFIGPDGVTRRSFPVGSKTMANATVRILGDCLWIASMSDEQSTSDQFVAKYNINSGQQIWRKTFTHGLKTFFELDANGNSFVGGTFQDLFGTDHDTVGCGRFELRKLDADGNVLWMQKWYGGKSYETNYENWMRTLAFSEAKNAVVVGGAIQKGDVHDQSRSAWIKIFNATTGDSFSTKTWSYTSSALISQVNSSAFNASGDLLVLGNTYSEGSTNIGYLEKYTFNKVTGVSGEPVVTPTSFSLSQNYPNPFNPTTTVRFTIPNASFVDVRVYDVLGREVAVLAGERFESGTHDVRFNASSLPSGTYLCRMVAGTFTKVVKMSLVK